LLQLVVVKRKLLKLEIELALPADLKTEDILNQLQAFLLDEIEVADDEFEWCPFDCGAITMTLLEEHPNVGIDVDDDANENAVPLVRELKKGSA
jgi:hypothetical protein